MNKPRTTAASKGAAAAAAAAVPAGESVRDSVEAVVVAIILTLVFRTFLGENYQIPTGSMAPTLQGRHMDVLCPECGYQYRTGASMENEEDGQARGYVRETTCPICRTGLRLDKKNNLNEQSFGGDRIIVNKLAYLFSEPQRWDVFVFKYPGNPKINYIKRLVGLPGETLRIRHGDLFTRDANPTGDGFRIARKPPHKVAAMLQLVDDTYYIPATLQQAGWPSRWGNIVSGGESWKLDAEQGSFSIQSTSQDVWLGYRNLIPRPEDTNAIERTGRVDLTDYHGQLITDYYEYNDSIPPQYAGPAGWNWVGDLAMEAFVEVLGDGGELAFDIVEGGIHHRCRIDVSTGQATLSIDDGQIPFRDSAGQVSPSTTGKTSLQGSGTYHLRFANVDDQLYLWVNGKAVAFDGPSTFDSPPDLKPQWSEQEPGDAVPLRIGSRQAEVRINRLRVLRDVYYVAVKASDEIGGALDYDGVWQDNVNEIYNVLTDPRTWSTTEMFSKRREVTFKLEQDQFFPMGDNSPQSKDGRLWSNVTPRGLEPPPYVAREMLIGKAVFIYWPHSWNFPKIPFMIPNFQRIGRIR